MGQRSFVIGVIFRLVVRRFIRTSVNGEPSVRR